MDWDTLLVAGLVIGMSLGTAAVIIAAIVLAHRFEPPERPAETQDDFTAAIRRWADMREGVRK
jgi:hypothetical protein